jgi:hypothetical protein
MPTIAADGSTDATHQQLSEALLAGVRYLWPRNQEVLNRARDCIPKLTDQQLRSFLRSRYVMLRDALGGPHITEADRQYSRGVIEHLFVEAQASGNCEVGHRCSTP